MTTALRQHLGGAPTGAYQETSYTYTPAGQMASLTSPAGNTWEWTYDQRGRKISTLDPDAGLSTSTYDDLDRLTSSTDARGQLISYTYDKLGRKTATYTGTVATGTRIAAWTWDTIAKGELYSAARYVDGKTYGVTYPTLDELYRPQRVRYYIPSVPGMEPLAGMYEFNTWYNSDGTVQGIGMPEAGGLPGEPIVFGYDDWRRPVSMSGTSSYVVDTEYAQTGELLQLELSTGGKKAWQTFQYEEGSKRLKLSQFDRQDAPAIDIYARYSYDDAGNVLSIADTPAGGQRDIQCFNYDPLRRLTRAWATQSTATDPCAGGPATTGVGGPAPYHHSYTYDTTGGRTSETVHSTVPGGTDVTRDYSYPAPGQPKAHSLSQVVEHTASGDRLYSYEYDAAGNMVERDQVGVTQTMNWDAEGQLASVVEGSQTTSYVYDADGSRLIRKEPNSTTLYLPGMELKLNNSSQTVDGTRFYSFAGRTVAVREVTGVKFLASDHHGTQSAVTDAVTGAVTVRRMTPFGGERGVAPSSWPGDKGFVGGTKDTTTGLTHLGARLYDPAVGRFISVDPVFVPDDPGQHNGYQYGRNNPVTFSDPTGLRVPPEDIGMLGGYSGNGSSGRAGSGPYAGGTEWSRGGGGGGGDSGEAQRLRKAREDAERAKQKLIDAAKMLTKIAMDELGITAALDCFTSGDLAACGEVALDIATTMIGGIAAKLARKYAAPWNWKRAADVASKVWNALGDLIGGARDWFKNSRLVKSLSGGGCKTGNSFVSGTLVLLADGSKRPIEELDVGDQVLATEPETGETAAKEVVATIIGQGDKHLVEVTIDTDGKNGGDSPIVATDGHPFWVASLNLWLDAADLSVGDWLQTSAGTWVQITALKRWTQQATVHNLTVAGIHTYFVLSAGVPVLVHNTSCPSSIALGLTSTDENPDSLFEFALDTQSTPWMDWEDPGNPWKTINQALDPDSNVQIHFNLDGIRNPVEWARNPQGALTAEELAAIRDAPASVQARVTWYSGGQPAKSPFAR
ncbi:RHS repeat-associated core domain-containing protein [Polymorphospora rubra]